MEILSSIGLFIPRLVTGALTAIAGLGTGIVTGFMKGFGRGFSTIIEALSSEVDTSDDLLGLASSLFKFGAGITIGIVSGIVGSVVGSEVGLVEGAVQGFKNCKSLADIGLCPWNYLKKRGARNLNFESDKGGLFSLVNLENEPHQKPQKDPKVNVSSSTNNVPSPSKRSSTTTSSTAVSSNPLPNDSSENVGVQSNMTKEIAEDYTKMFVTKTWYKPPIEENGNLLLKFGSEKDVVSFFRQQASLKKDRCMLIVDKKQKVMGYIQGGELYHSNGEQVKPGEILSPGEIEKDKFVFPTPESQHKTQNQSTASKLSPLKNQQSPSNPQPHSSSTSPQ